MKFPKIITLITLMTSFLVSLIGVAAAQPSKRAQPMVKSKTSDLKIIDTIESKEAEDKNARNGNGWNGSYIGANAGASFGATVGTNAVIPLGSEEK